MDHPDHARTRKTSDNFINAERSQLRLHDGARAGLLEPEFGICVQIVTPLGHFLMKPGDLAYDGHGRLLKRRRRCLRGSLRAEVDGG